MGHPKAWLQFDGIPQVTRIASMLSQVCSTVIVSAAEDQALPTTPDQACIVRDQDVSQGPLAGLCACRSWIPADCEAVFIAACDLPFLKTPVIERFLTLLESGTADAVIARQQDRWHPLCAAYRATALAHAERLFANGGRRVLDWVAALNVLMVTPADFQDLAGGRHFWENVNSPDDYERALAQYRSDAPAR